MAAQELSYSRDETVAAVTDFYEFLTRIHIPPTAIKYPPPGGWPELTREDLTFLNKNDDVIDLIRHLPFIKRDDYYDPYEIYEQTTVVDFTGKLLRKEAASKPHNSDLFEPLEEISTVPSHVLTLATTSGTRDGHFVFIDTSRGTGTICDFQDGPEPTALSLPKDEDAEENDHGEVCREEWRHHLTYNVHDFFELLKESTFSDVETPQVATNEREVRFERDFDGSTMDRLKQIYNEHAWLTEDYQREECMQKVNEVTKL
ncbi:MAG: hypothetical protein Q9227_002643 [Pyrenula ochraceoflavens]